MLASGRPALPPSASRPRPPWGEAAGATLGRMVLRSHDRQRAPSSSAFRLAARPPWGEAAGTTLRRMFSREPRGPPIPASVRLHLGPRPGIEALKRRGSDVAGRGPHHDSAESGRFGGVYCRLAPSRQDSRVPPGPHAPWCRLVTSVDPGGPQAVDLPSPGRKWGRA